MLYSIFAVLSLASTAIAIPNGFFDLFPRAACNANNCLRAVTGTQPGQTQTRADRIGDCSSFLRKTVTPDAVTVTVTDPEAVPTDTFFKRAVTDTPTNVPAYASPCSGTVKYSSACLCYGATGMTITVEAPTETATVLPPPAPTPPPTTCVSPLATLFTGYTYAGEGFRVCGQTCKALPENMSFSSIQFGTASSCLLYASSSDCSATDPSAIYIKSNPDLETIFGPQGPRSVLCISAP